MNIPIRKRHGVINQGSTRNMGAWVSDRRRLEEASSNTPKPFSLHNLKLYKEAQKNTYTIWGIIITPKPLSNYYGPLHHTLQPQSPKQ